MYGELSYLDHDSRYSPLYYGYGADYDSSYSYGADVDYSKIPLSLKLLDKLIEVQTGVVTKIGGKTVTWTSIYATTRDQVTAMSKVPTDSWNRVKQQDVVIAYKDALSDMGAIKSLRLLMWLTSGGGKVETGLGNVLTAAKLPERVRTANAALIAGFVTTGQTKTIPTKEELKTKSDITKRMRERMPKQDALDKQAADQAAADAAAGATVGGIPTTTLLLGAGALAAVYFLFMRKKPEAPKAVSAFGGAR